MGKGEFYSVGVGPGDPQLITFKAVSVIKNCDVIAVAGSGGDENIALKIAEEHVKGKTVIVCDMPMIREKEQLEMSHNVATTQIETLLNKGQSVAFLTLGDPSIYSTTLYVHEKLTQKGHKTRIIPGVPSFCAVAASLNIALCQGKEALHIIPASYENTDYALDLIGTKVLMKSGKSLKKIKEKLALSKDKNSMVMMVECASTEKEKVVRTLDEIDESASYFSVVVVK